MLSTITCQDFFDILKAIFVRCILVTHALMAVWRVTVSYHSNLYWILALILALLFAESCYTIIRRKGKEYQRFMPAFLFYLSTLLSCIWLLELDKTEKYLLGQAELLDKQINSSQDLRIPAPSLTPNTWIMFVEEMFPYLVLLSRWILPRGKVNRKELVELLFAFIGIGGDIMEYFSLLGEEAVRPNRRLCYVVLAIWSLSVLQFTVTITVIHQPKRQRNINVVIDSVELVLYKKRQKFWYEVLAILLTLLMQDIPFLIVRLYIMISCNIVNYSLIFFTSKNAMIISLLIYKLFIVCGSYYLYDEDDENGAESSDNLRRKKGGSRAHRDRIPDISSLYFKSKAARSSFNNMQEALINDMNKTCPKSPELEVENISCRSVSSLGISENWRAARSDIKHKYDVPNTASTDVTWDGVSARENTSPNVFDETGSTTSVQGNLTSPPRSQTSLDMIDLKSTFSTSSYLPSSKKTTNKTWAKKSSSLHF